MFNLCYADDIDLLDGSLHELQDVLTRVSNESKVICLGLNIKKTKWMIISKKALPQQQLSINSKVIEPVDDFIYLDYKINRQLNDSVEIRRRRGELMQHLYVTSGKTKQ